jgi:hypothetical protein
MTDIGFLLALLLVIHKEPRPFSHQRAAQRPAELLQHVERARMPLALSMASLAPVAELLK